MDASSVRRSLRRLAALPVVTRKRTTCWAEIVRHGIQLGRVLNVGSRDTSYGRDSVNLDHVTYPGVGVAGDAHDLPFADESFDTCVISAVLQYCRTPDQVIAEAWRVLAPGGHVVIDAPFIQPYCPEVAALDLWRFTEHGLRALCEPRFQVITCTVSIGTPSAVTFTLQQALGSSRHRVLRLLLQLAASLVIWPFGRVQHTYAPTAGAFVLIGRKPAAGA